MLKGVKILGLLFFPLVALYTLGVSLRNRLYDWGILPSCALKLRAISVGNIQIGGTGKTPFTEYLARLLLKQGVRVAILTRGYRRQYRGVMVVDESNRSKVSPQQIGDEPYLLLQNLPEVILGVGADRCETAKRILQRYPEAVFLLDDGFQHRRLPRRLDVVLIDPTRWSRWPFLFPLTHFRDVKSSLRRAGLIVLTRSGQQPEQTRRVESWIRAHLHCPIIRATVVPRELVPIFGGKRLIPNQLANRRVAAFCGLANPQQFFRTLTEAGALLVYTRAVPDHHHYTEQEVQNIARRAVARGAQWLVTTQKDAVKIATLGKLNSLPFYYLTIEMKLEGDPAPLEKAVAAALTGAD